MLEATLGVTNDLLRRNLLDALAQRISAWAAVSQSQQIRSKTSNMGTSHTCPGQDGSRVRAIDPSTFHKDTWSPNIDKSAVVGKSGADIVLIDSADSASLWRRSWRRLLDGEIRISSRNSAKESLIHRRCDSSIECVRVRGGQRKVSDRLVDAAAVLRVLNCPVQSGDDAEKKAHAVDGENFNADQVGLLSNTVSFATNGAGDVGAVAVAVDVILIDKIRAEGGTVFEFRVLDVDALIG